MSELLLFIVCVLCVSLKKSYQRLSESPSRGQTRAPAHLYRTLKHILFLETVLEIILLGAFALFAISVAFSAELGWSFPVIFVGLVLIFIVLPKLPLSAVELKLAETLSKPLAHVLIRLKKPISGIEKLLVKTRRSIDKPKPLSSEALKAFLTEQAAAAQPAPQALLALAGLKLAGEKIGHFMVRWNKIRFVGVNEEVGPVLLSELHASGRKVFPVKDKDPQAAGIVYLHGLSELKEGGKAGGVLIRQMVVAGKNDPAITAVKRFVESGAELVFVEDETGEPVGVVYLEDVLGGLADEIEDGRSLE